MVEVPEVEAEEVREGEAALPVKEVLLSHLEGVTTEAIIIEVYIMIIIQRMRVLVLADLT